MPLPIRSPRPADVPVSHRDRLGRLERRIRSDRGRKPKKSLVLAEFGVSGPVIVGSTGDWPAPDNLLTSDVYATLVTASTSGSVVAVLKKNGNATPVLTVTFGVGVTEVPMSFVERLAKDADKLRMEVTSAGTGARYLHVQVRGR